MQPNNLNFKLQVGTVTENLNRNFMNNDEIAEAFKTYRNYSYD